MINIISMIGMFRCFIVSIKHMKYITLWILLGLSGGVLLHCSSPANKEILYPAQQPDSIALPFLPGIVATDSLDFNSAFSPDGKTYFFSRSINRRYEILMSVYDGQQWSAAKSAPFSELAYSEADAAFAPDGTLYYISDRPRNKMDTIPDFDIWYVRQKDDGNWTTPQNLETVNTDSTEYYVSFSTNGNLYFASNKAGGLGLHDIYVSKRVNEIYTKPENLGIEINTPRMEHDPCISQDEQLLFFTSVDRTDSYGSADIYYAIKTPDGKWSQARNLGSRVNTETYEYCSYLTPDHKYFFFSSNYDVKWIAADFLPVRSRGL
jgi:hypothetical protein